MYFKSNEIKAPFGYMDFKSRDFTYLFNENSLQKRFSNRHKDFEIEFESFIMMYLK